jgi:hypothetical protein
MNPMRRPLACALVIVLLVACSTPGSSAPSGSGAASATPTPQAVATAIPTGEPASPGPSGPALATAGPTGPSWTARPLSALLLDALVHVLVDRLNIRDEPSTGGKIVGLAERGDFLRIYDYGPISNGGYTWYAAVFLAPAGEPPIDSMVNVRDSDGIRGWIAVGPGNTSYVEQLRPRCPQAIDLASIEQLLGAELLGCFGRNSIELTGTFGCSGCGGARPGTFEPEWLAHPLNFNLLTVYPVADHVGPFVLHFPPDGPTAPPVASVVRVRGHFDDAAADTCAISVIDPLEPGGDALITIPAEAAHLACAQQFVVESVEVLGTDPGFTFG